MLDVVLLTVFFLSRKAINYATDANLLHRTLGLLIILAALDITDGSMTAFLNHGMLSLSCLMVFDIFHKTSLELHRRSSTSKTAHDISQEPWTSHLPFHETQGAFIQESPSVGSGGTNDMAEQGLKEAIDAIKRRLIRLTPTKPSFQPGKENAVPKSESTPGAAAERVASLKKSLGTGMPAKRLREIDPNSPFHTSSKDKARRRNRAQ